jgi:hypothetical protein
MSNRVFTYFDPLFDETKAQEADLVIEWKRNWRAAGWTPTVLCHQDAATNPLYARFSKAVYALPTTNNKDYEMACWNRWLAYQMFAAVFGPSLFIDYDVAATTVLKRPEYPCWLALGYDPGCFADSQMLREVVELMMACGLEGSIEIDGRPHISDMTLLNKLGHEIAPNLGICSLYPSTNQLVHVSNGSVISHGAGRTRLSIFKEVAAQLKP